MCKVADYSVVCEAAESFDFCGYHKGQERKESGSIYRKRKERRGREGKRRERRKRRGGKKESEGDGTEERRDGRGGKL